MSAFKYEALDTGGRTVGGVIEGDVPRQVRSLLREKGLVPLKVEAVAAGRETARGVFQVRRISGATLAILTRQFATLVRAGLSIEESLAALIEQCESDRARAVLAAVRARVLEGRSLTQGMAAFPHVFSELYRSLVHAGEQSGKLDDILERLADYTEKRQALQQKVVLALVYPALLTLVALAVVTGLLVSVVPQVTRVFLNTGQHLPLSTRILMHLSSAVRGTPLTWLILLLASGWGTYVILRRPAARAATDRWLLRLPGIGRLVRSLNAERLTSTLGILTSSGIPLLSAMRSAVAVVSNRPMRRAVEKALRQVSEGASLSRSLGESKLFPPLIIHLIASGEASGRLDVMLARAAEAQSRELESWVTALTTLVEPLLILFMGGIVLFIVLAILSPIMEMNQFIH